MKKFRIEKDMIGELQVENSHYYGVHTARALENFNINYQKTSKHIIHAYAKVKIAAANANYKTGKLDKEKCDAIVSACMDIIDRKYDDQFLLPGIQGGAGTSTNMNVNEVVANIALEKLGHEKGEFNFLDPLEHVNLSQSTNDSYPTSLRVAILYLTGMLEKSVKKLHKTLEEKAVEFKNVQKLGRTQLEDAVPITLGQEFSAYATAIGRDIERIENSKHRFLYVNMGGTAIGTGVGTTPEYRKIVIEELSKITKLDMRANKCLIDGTQNLDDYVEFSGVLKTLTVNLKKIANDLRLMNSGPKAGLREVFLPVLQAGSSIMPKKVNPVGAEFAIQIHYKIKGNDLIITDCASGGEFELNANEPLLADAIIESLKLARDGIINFNDKVIAGVKANFEACKTYMDTAPTAATVLINELGYEKVSEIISEVNKTGKNYKEIAIEMGFLTKEYFENN